MSTQILFISANPSETTKLRVDEECNIIDAELRGSEFGRQFELEQRHAVSLSDLSEYLQRFRPRIVHFSGHGSDEGRLVFQNENGVAESANPAALARLFRILNDGAPENEKIKCVVLSACFSDKEQARAIANYVDCVIGISDEIKDESAIKFAAHFYQALGYGHSVRKAFELGCVQLGLEDNPDENIIKLEHREGIDPAQVYLADKQAETQPEATVAKKTKSKSLSISIAAGASALAIIIVLFIVPALPNNGPGLGGIQGAEAAQRGYYFTSEGQKVVPESPVKVLSFQAKPAVVASGQSSEISWVVIGDSANSVVIEPEIGQMPLAGSRVVFPREDTTYSMIATDRSGADYRAELKIFMERTEVASGGNETAASVEPPFQISPGYGSIFNNYPRTITLEWAAIAASSYTVEIQYCYDKQCTSYKTVSDIKDTNYTFDFVGAQEGRWRVWAVDEDGNEMPKTDWWTFSYSR